MVLPCGHVICYSCSQVHIIPPLYFQFYGCNLLLLLLLLLLFLLLFLLFFLYLYLYLLYVSRAVPVRSAATAPVGALDKAAAAAFYNDVHRCVVPYTMMCTDTMMLYIMQ